MIDFTQLPILQNEDPASVAIFIIDAIRKNIPNSSTKLSLQKAGYPADGSIETTIRDYQQKYSGLETGYYALETGCGNCQDMAYAAALILRAAGYQGEIAIGEFGINHRFLFVDDMIVDPWSEMYCWKKDWKDHLSAYGGSIKEGIMRGRILSTSHEELEDEVPEIIESIPLDVEPILHKCMKPGPAYGEAINKTLFQSVNSSTKADNNSSLIKASESKNLTKKCP